VELVTTRGVGDAELGVVDTREVEGTSGLHLAHGEAERPRIGGDVINGSIGEVSAVHFSNYVMVIDVRCVFEERSTINVQSGGIKFVLLSVITISRLTRDKMNGFHWMIEIREVKLGIGVRRWLVLSLGDEELMVVVCEELALFGIEVHIVAVYLGGTTGGVTIAALHTNLDIVVLERHKGKTLRPVLTKEERNHVVVPGVVTLTGIGGDCETGLSTRIPHEGIVDALNVEGVKLRNLLSTNPKSKLGRSGSVLGEETISIGRDIRNISILDPNVAHEITLRANRNGNFVVRTESSDVIQALRLHGEVGVAFIVLTEEADLGITRDVDILGTHRHELN